MKKTILLLTINFFFTSYSQEKCFDFYSTVICSNYEKSTIEYQNCYFQWFCENEKWLNVKREDLCKYYNVNFGSNLGSLKEDKIPWISNYFLFIHGGIATKWQGNHFNPKYYKYNSKTHTPISDLNWENVKLMSEKEINLLSPAEKYDIYKGYKDFRITKWELQNRGPFKGDLANWDGYCNGVRAAGILIPEPQNNLILSSAANPNLKITFYPTDLKALAIASCFNVTDYVDIGNPRQSPIIPNPTIFDVALRFLIGTNMYPILFDRYSEIDQIREKDTADEIWNTTIIGYSRKIISENKKFKIERFPTVSKAVTIECTIKTIEDIDNIKDFNANSKKLILKNDPKYVHSKKYKYELWIDDKNEIVSGKWIGNYPDHIWFAIGEGTQYGLNPKGELVLYGNENLDYKEIKALVETSNKIMEK